MNTKYKNILGKVFGQITVISPSNKKDNKSRAKMWLCKCSCGNEKIIFGSQLRSGAVRSCGCGMKKTQFDKVHGLIHTLEYKRWAGMKSRCKSKPTYVKKGIKVCPQWENNFEQFFADMGKCPSKKHTIERTKNDEGYFKENCIWATQKVQNRNYSQNRVVELNGEKKCVTEWAEIYNVDRGLLYNRLNLGWSIERAIKQPIRVNS